MGRRRRVAILGSTGSIGRQALEVIAEDACSPEPSLEVVALTAHGNVELLVEQARACAARVLLASEETAAGRLRDAVSESLPDVQVVSSMQELLDAVEVDLVLNAVVGFAGLTATLESLGRGIDVALANKESLVAAGSLCMETARASGARIIPVDSEHSALMQCIGASEPQEITSLVLTASGGPFFGRTRGELAGVTVEQALDHPTWSMGGKITIDSASLMNKGLELIEAMVLFDVPEQDVEVVVHRHSIVHAMTRHRDGSLLAHLGWPDMRVPIAWALHWPERPSVALARRLDLTQMPALEFHQPDTDTFQCLALAREAGRAGGGAPCVLNAANEVAVEAFLAGGIGFLDIARVVAGTLDELGSQPVPADLASASELDAGARRAAARICHGSP